MNAANDGIYPLFVISLPVAIKAPGGPETPYLARPTICTAKLGTKNMSGVLSDAAIGQGVLMDQQYEISIILLRRAR